MSETAEGGASPLPFKEKLFELTHELGTIEKDGWNDFHNYAYFSDEKMTQSVRVLFRKYRLLFSATCAAVEILPNGLTQVKMVYRIDDLDSINYKEYVYYGHGQDKGDKGIYKGYTGAKKYSFNQNFLIGGGDDPEQVDREEKVPAPKPVSAQKKLPITPREVREEQSVPSVGKVYVSKGHTPKEYPTKDTDYDQSTPPRIKNPYLWKVRGVEGVENIIVGKHFCELANGVIKKMLKREFKDSFHPWDLLFAADCLKFPDLRDSALEDFAAQSRPEGYVDFSEDQMPESPEMRQD